MCGLTGFWAPKAPTTTDHAAMVGCMADTLRHRGPDDAGVWVDTNHGVALGHRRLAIVDLSAAGHQPMASTNGRYVISFNGEIYNHLELRASLAEEGVHPMWRGHSDTETLLAAIEHWGLTDTLQRSVGMFALALWQRDTATLHLARDRMGEKPLYFGWVGTGDQRALAFASELKALRAYPGFTNPVSRTALAQYLRFMYVPAPLSIHEEVFKLPPGCVLTLTEADAHHAPAGGVDGLAMTAWWSLASAVFNGRQQTLHNPEQALAALEQRLGDAVIAQSAAEVPLGAFLSGGVDSSTVVALMQARSGRQVQTFTIGFDEAGFDESPHAQRVADHLGTDHHTLRVTASDARKLIPELPWMYDEPFADASQIPMHLVCRAARQHVTVALSGDAGDELFGGYNRYLWAPGIWNKTAWLPHTLRQALARRLAALPGGDWGGSGRLLGVVRPGEKLNKLGHALDGVRSVDDLYFNLIAEKQDPELLMQPASTGPLWATRISALATVPAGLDAAERMMYRDSVGYLPDDILVKVDRAAMAISLETRAPFLDHRVVEFAWQLPMTLKVRGNTGKWLLRQLLYKHVPRELIERPKSGFAIPIGQWLRGPLRAWAEDLLDPVRLQAEGFLQAGIVQRMWQEHQSGRRDWTTRLWSILMFQAWLRKQG